MNTKTKKFLVLSSRIMFYIMAALCIFAGLNYLLRGDLMPYHYAFLGKTADQLDTKVMQLLRAAVQIIGGFLLGTGIAFGILTYHIEKARNVILPAMVCIMAIPLAAAFPVVMGIGETIPVLLIVSLAVLLALGFIIVYFSGKE